MKTLLLQLNLRSKTTDEVANLVLQLSDHPNFSARVIRSGNSIRQIRGRLES